MDVLLTDEGGHPPSRNVEGVEIRDVPDVQGISILHRPAQSQTQTSSNLSLGSNQANMRRRSRNILIKRPRKAGSATNNAGEGSTSVSNDSEIMFLGSSGELSNSGSIGNQSHHCQDLMEPVIEIDDQSPEIRNVASRNRGGINSDDSDARARQIEADEIMARELQEQLYHEMPVGGGAEVSSLLL